MKLLLFGHKKMHFALLMDRCFLPAENKMRRCPIILIWNNWWRMKKCNLTSCFTHDIIAKHRKIWLLWPDCNMNFKTKERRLRLWRSCPACWSSAPFARSINWAICCGCLWSPALCRRASKWAIYWKSRICGPPSPLCRVRPMPSGV